MVPFFKGIWELVLARGTLPNRLVIFQETWQSLVECAGLENRKRLITFHGFESHSFRQILLFTRDWHIGLCVSLPS